MAPVVVSTTGAEIGHFASSGLDLVQAREALELAVQRHDEASTPLEGAKDALVAAAAMAYCRTFFRSNLRRPMTDVFELPEALRATQQLVKMFRNRTIVSATPED